MHRPVRRNGVLKPDQRLVRRLATAATLANEARSKGITVVETPDFYIAVRSLPAGTAANYAVHTDQIDKALGFSFQRLFPNQKPIISISPNQFPATPLPDLGTCTAVESSIQHELVHHMQYARGAEDPSIHELRTSKPPHGLPPRKLHPSKKERDKNVYWWSGHTQNHAIRSIEFQPLIGDALAEAMRYSAWKDPAVDLRKVLLYHPFPAWKKDDPARWRAGVGVAAAEIEKLYVKRFPDRNRPGPVYKDHLQQAAWKKSQYVAALAAQEAEAERRAKLIERVRRGMAAQETDRELRQRKHEEAAGEPGYLNRPPVHLYEVRRGPDPRDPRGGGQVWIVYKDTQPTTKYAKTKQKALELMAEMEARHG